MATQYEVVVRLRFADDDGVTVERVRAALDRRFPKGAYLAREDDDGITVDLQVPANDTSIAERAALDAVTRALADDDLHPVESTVDDVKSSS